MPQPIVFFDIAGLDAEPLKSFYAAVFDWTADEKGQFDVPVVLPLQAAIRQDPTEMRLYIGVSDVSASLAQVKSHGGTIDAPRFEVPGVVVLGLFKDPAGNPLGLVEMDGDRPMIP